MKTTKITAGVPEIGAATLSVGGGGPNDGKPSAEWYATRIARQKAELSKIQAEVDAADEAKRIADLRAEAARDELSRCVQGLEKLESLIGGEA